MLRLTTSTIEEQIGELDAYMDQILRKPRREITNIVCKVPGGCLMEPVVSGESLFVGFFAVDGSIEGLRAQLPDTAKPCQLIVESVTCNVTNSITFSISKGCNLLTESVPIQAGTKISIKIITDNPIASALFGYVFVPEVL